MKEKILSELKSSSVIVRYQENPVLKAKDVPYPSTLVFNAGVVKFKGKYVMVFRNDMAEVVDNRFNFIDTNNGLAFSDDGLSWDVQPDPCFYMHDDENIRAYDFRLTVIEGRCYACFAVDTNHGVRGVIAVTDDFDKFEILSMSVPDNRNMVLFPEKIHGHYVRLERPFPVYGRGGKDKFDIWLSNSPDMKYWGNSHLVLAVEDVPFANDKIGPAAPPVKTDKGWLTLFHAVDRDDDRGKNGWEDTWKKRYTTGVMLLDIDQPWIVKGMSKMPVMVPEASYEVSGGYRNNVIFPGGMILEDDGEIKIYYGSADTVECLAITNIDDLLNLCISEK